MLIGYELSGSPIVLYTKEMPVSSYFEDGELVDKEGLAKALSSFHHFDDDSIKLRGDIAEISLVIPPLGLKIYQKMETSLSVSPTKEIARIDLANVIAQVQNEPIPGGNETVDIIPGQFILDNGETYVKPPLGQKSATLTVKAKIHTLPHDLYSEVKSLCVLSNFRTKKIAVAPYCEALLFATDPSLPKSCLLIDMGSKLTTITLIGEGEPYNSGFFKKGGDDLTLDISDGFGIPYVEAEKIKKRYGYDKRSLSFDPPLIKGVDGHIGEETSYYQKDLNSVIESYFEGYMAKLANAISTLLEPYRGQFDELPIIITGGASKLNGLQAFFDKAFPKRKLYLGIPKVIGARDPRYSALLGLVLSSSSYIGSLEDQYRGVAPVSRVSKKEKKSKPSLTEDLL